MNAQRIVLAARPDGERIRPEMFGSEAYEPPAPGPLEVALRTRYTSVAPFQRQRMIDVPSYVSPFAIGEVIAADSVSEVVDSRHEEFSPGDLVVGRTGWQTHPVVHGRALTRIDRGLAEPVQWLSALGSPGLTAYFALFDLAPPRPDDLVLVTSAAGAVGGFAGQFARLAGARTVGIAGGAEKCERVVRRCGFDAAVDYRAPDFADRLKDACRGQVDVFLDLVGGRVADQVFEQLAPRARIVLCGRTASTHSDTPELDMANLRHVWVQEASIRSFSLYGYAARLGEARQRVAGWLRSGRVVDNAQRVTGLESAPGALCDFVAGRYAGRVVIEVV